MVKTEVIKAHNKNIENAIDIWEKYNGYFSYDMPYIDFKTTKKDFGYINSISKIFTAKKQIVNGYNLLTKIYNKTIDKINNINYKLNDRFSKMKAFEKRIKNLSEQESKLKLICDSLTKPDNYDYCLKLKREKEQCKTDLDATITKSHIRYVDKEVEHRRGAYVAGLPYATTEYTTERVPETVHVSYPDTEKRAKAKQRLEEIENEIKTIPNYKYNLNLENLYSQYNFIKDMPEYLTQNLINDKMKTEIVKLQLSKKNLQSFLKEFDGCVDIEKALVEKSNINLTKNELTQLSELKTYKPYKIPERFITYYIDNEGFGDENSLNYWKNKVNEFIDTFDIKNVEKNDMSKAKKDYVDHYYDYDYVYDDGYYYYDF